MRKATRKQDDDFAIPSFLLLTDEQRRAAWEKNPPRAMPQSAMVGDPKYQEQKRQIALNKIAKMKARKATKEAKATAVSPLALIEYRRGSISAADHKRILAELPTKRHCKLFKDMYQFDGKRWCSTAPKPEPAPAPIQVEQPRPARSKGPADDVATRLKELTDNIPERAVHERIKALAKANGLWSDDYGRLSPGLLRMTVGNRLRALSRKASIVWP